MQSQLNVYNDGSKTDSHTGAGYVIIKGTTTIKEGMRRLPDEATVFQAELMAIQMTMVDLSGIIKTEDSNVTACKIYYSHLEPDGRKNR